MVGSQSLTSPKSVTSSPNRSKTFDCALHTDSLYTNSPCVLVIWSVVCVCVRARTQCTRGRCRSSQSEERAERARRPTRPHLPLIQCQSPISRPVPADGDPPCSRRPAGGLLRPRRRSSPGERSIAVETPPSAPSVGTQTVISAGGHTD